MTDNNIEKMSELLPCPFCKTTLRKESWGYSHDTVEDGCPLNAIAWTLDSKAFAKWNTRTESTQLTTLTAQLKEAEEALEKISKAKPDRLDHSIDIAIIERAVSIAKQALSKIKESV